MIKNYRTIVFNYAKNSIFIKIIRNLEGMMVKIDGFSKYKFLSSLKVSDTNEFATVISHVADLKSDCYKSKFYILNLDKKTRKHIDTDFDITLEEWLNKDTLLLKTSFRDGKTHFLNFNVQNNEICESFVLSKNVKAFKTLDLNKIVLLIGDDVSDPEDFKQNDKYEIIDEIPFWDNNSGFISKKRTRLYIYDKNSKEMKLISPDMMNGIIIFISLGSFISLKKSCALSIE